MTSFFNYYYHNVVWHASSANFVSLTDGPRLTSKSLTKKILKRYRPLTLPCVVPLITIFQSYELPFKISLYFRSLRKLRYQLPIHLKFPESDFWFWKLLNLNFNPWTFLKVIMIIFSAYIAHFYKYSVRITILIMIYYNKY